MAVIDEMALLAALGCPPRSVRGGAESSAKGHRARMLFAMAGFVVGGALLGLASLYFSPDYAPDAWTYYRLDRVGQTAAGTVATRTRKDFADRQRPPEWDVSYTFRDARGHRVAGSCLLEDREMRQLPPDGAIPIVYLPENTGVSRVAGHDSGLGRKAAVMAGMAVLGLFLAAGGIVAAHSGRTLLRDGVAAQGQVETSAVTTRKLVRYLTLEVSYRDPGGALHRVSGEWPVDGESAGAYPVGKTVAILHDPHRPDRAAIMSLDYAGITPGDLTR